MPWPGGIRWGTANVFGNKRYMNDAGNNPQFDVVARAAVLEESPLCKMVAERYESFDSGLGKKFEEGNATLEDLYNYAKVCGERVVASGKQELYETLLNLYAVR